MTDQPLAADTRLHDRYRVHSVLGQGGMSRVYLATDEVLEVPVAIKENLQVDPTAHTQFRNEAEFLARLVHPNLPRVTDYFIAPDSGLEYLVMDYVEGDDLSALVAREGPLSQDKAVEYISQVLGALEYLHSRQPPIIHRDIKPSNIKLTPEGKAVLVDFGIAKAYEASALTQTGARAVTPGFAPPEQYGMRTDARSDIYATGATLFTLLTGQIPPEATLRVANVVAMPDLGVLAPNVAPYIRRAVLKAMEPDTTKRWSSAREFRNALLAPPPPIAAETVAVSAVMSPASAPTVALKPNTAPESAPATVAVGGRGVPPPAAPKGGSRTPMLIGGVIVALLVLGGIGLFLSGAIGGGGGATPTAPGAAGVAGNTPTAIGTAEAMASSQPTEVAVVAPSTVTVAATSVATTAPTAAATGESATTPTETAATEVAVTAVEPTVALTVPAATEAPTVSTATTVPPIAATQPAPTVPGPAAIGVNDVRLDPPEQHRGTNVQFFVTFNNTFDAPQQQAWSVWIFQATNPRKTFWTSRTVNSTLAVGESEASTLSTDPWCICGGGPPQDYVLRIRDLSTGAYMKGPDGQPYSKSFTVTP